MIVFVVYIEHLDSKAASGVDGVYDSQYKANSALTETLENHRKVCSVPIDGRVIRREVK